MSNPEVKSLIDLSTAVEPALPFTVDGEFYELRTISHLSKIEEARLRTLNKQEEFILAKIEAADPEKQQALVLELHKKLFDLRVELICMMTTIPEEKANAIPPMQQQRLITFVGLEVEVILARQKEEEEAEEAEAAAEDTTEEETPLTEEQKTAEVPLTEEQKADGS